MPFEVATSRLRYCLEFTHDLFDYPGAPEDVVHEQDLQGPLLSIGISGSEHHYVKIVLVQLEMLTGAFEKCDPY